MRRMVRRGLALALGTGVGTCLGGGLLTASMLSKAGWPSLEDLRCNAEHALVGALAPARAEAIREELASLVDHPWAGRYTTPGIHPEELLLAPEGGFTIYVNTGCGNCTGFEAVGRVESLAPDRLRLVPDAAHWALHMRSRAPQELHLIEWDGRRMAVLETQAEDFCATLTARKAMPDAYLRRLDGEARVQAEPCPPGRPALPEALRALAPEQPIAGRILGLAEEPTQRDATDSDAVNALFRLDLGSDDGLAVGMRLRIEGVDSSGRVESVERESATLRHWAGGRYNPPLDTFVGRAVRTLHPEPADDD